MSKGWEILTGPQAIGPLCVWLTGLPGAGKTTLARALAEGKDFAVLDGDELRRGPCADLGFSREDRRENALRAAQIARGWIVNGRSVVVALVSPYDEDRQEAMRVIGRDRVLLVHLTGLHLNLWEGTVYEEPQDADLRLDTAHTGVEECVGKLSTAIAEKMQPRALEERVAAAWDWSDGLPVPRFDLRCPVCRSEAVQMRQWAFFPSNRSPKPWRCDVMPKCQGCSFAWTHGVAIPEELYEARANDQQGSMTYRYSEVQQRLEETGSPVPPPRVPRAGPLEVQVTGISGVWFDDGENAETKAAARAEAPAQEVS